MFNRKIKTIFTLLSLGIINLSFAANPSDNCHGPIDGNNNDHCQDGNNIDATGMCSLAGVDTGTASKGLCVGRILVTTYA